MNKAFLPLANFEYPINDKFMAAMSFLDCPIICVASDYSITAINEIAAKFFNYESVHLINKNFREHCEHFHIENLPLFDSRIGVFNGEIIKNFLTSSVTVNKKIYDLVWTIVKQTNQQHETVGYILLFRDVTEKLSLVKENRMLKNIVRSMPGHVYWKNKNGEFMGCNENQARDAGMSCKQMIGKTDKDMPWKADAKILRKNDLEIMDTGVAQMIEEPGEMINGKNLIFLSNKLPLRNEAGDIIGILGISFDITGRKQIEDSIEVENKEKMVALRKMVQQLTGLSIRTDGKPEEYAQIMADFYENLIAKIPGNVYWKNKKGIILGCNDEQARILNFKSRKEIIGLTDYDLYEKNLAEGIRRADLEIMNSNIEQTFIEKAKPFINDEPSVYLAKKVPLRDSKGKVVGLLGISLNITEQEKAKKALEAAKEEAEAANQAKTEFLANMRHDIRTPLSGVVSYAELIKDAKDDPDKIENYADNLVASGRALLDLLNEILETIKIATGEIPVLKQKFDLKAQLNSIVDLNQAKAKEKNLDLILNYDDTIPYLIGDPVRIHRVILELVSNALNFTSEGFVKISTGLASRKGQDVIIQITVQDTGIGIPEDKQREIFLQFKRLTPSYQGIYKGTGLGLTVANQFMSDIGGEIYVESEVDKGSTFICILPLRAALLNDDTGLSPLVVSEKKDAVSVIASTKKKLISTGKLKNRILLVEDSATAADAEKETLQNLACRVDIASEGNIAIELFKKNPYDLILMDIGLPDMNGYEVTKAIRLLEGNKNGVIPIIALSAHTETSYKKQCIEAGMNGVLSKPLLKSQAKDILDNFIPSRQYEIKQKKMAVKEKVIEEKDKNLLKLDAKILDLDFLKNELSYKEAALKKFPKMFATTLPEDILKLEEAYEQKNLMQVKNLAHKIKGGAIYAGALRLRDASSRLEIYLMEGKREMVSDLYELVIKEAKAYQDYMTKM